MCLKSLINNNNSIIEQLVARDRNDNWKKFLLNLNGNPKAFWKATKTLRGKRKSLPDQLNHNGTIIFADKAKAEALADNFAASHNIASTNGGMDLRVNRFIRRFLNQTITDEEINKFGPGELTGIIKNLRPFKAPGNDEIHNILLKNLPQGAINYLCKIFNRCLQLNYWPKSFKTAKVIPIPKAGKSTDSSSSYRPISLLNSIGKIDTGKIDA